MKQVRYYIGTGEDKKHNKIDNVASKLQKCASFLSENFGGCSVFEGFGYWKEDTGYTARESSVMIEIITGADNKEIASAGRKLKDIFQQNSVLMSISEIFSSCI